MPLQLSLEAEDLGGSKMHWRGDSEEEIGLEIGLEWRACVHGAYDA